MFQEEDLARLLRTMQERGFCSSDSGLSAPSSGAAGRSNPLATTTRSLTEAQGVGGRDASAAAMENILGVPSRAPVDANSAAGAAAAGVEGMAGEEEAARDPGVLDVPSRKAIDIVLHSVAHAPTDAMRQGLIMVRQTGERISLDKKE